MLPGTKAMLDCTREYWRVTTKSRAHLTWTNPANGPQIPTFCGLTLRSFNSAERASAPAQQDCRSCWLAIRKS